MGGGYRGGSVSRRELSVCCPWYGLFPANLAKNPSYSSSRPVFRVRLQFSPGRRAQDIVKYGFLQPFVLSCFRPIPLSVGPDGVWRGVRGLSRCSLNGLQFRRMNRVSAFSVRITASMLKKKMRFPVHRYRKIVYLLLVFLMSEK